jgi:hypothetical protein
LPGTTRTSLQRPVLMFYVNDATTTERIVFTLMTTSSCCIRINSEGTIWQSHWTIIMTNDDPFYFGKLNKCKTRISLISVLGLPSVFSRVRVARSIVFCVVFCRSFLSFCPFSLGNCFVCPSPIYGFWLSVWFSSS